MEFKHLEIDGMRYVKSYPQNFKSGEKHPVIIYLHGAGTRGTDISLLEGSSFFKGMGMHTDSQFILVAPQCHENTWFDLMPTLKKLVYAVAQDGDIDEKRIYLIGNSMGGYATWQLAMSIPEMFAAIVPICGGGMYWNAARLANVPVWAFHGALDKTVLTEESEKMVNAVNKKGGNARLTVYPENGHNSWDDTYKNPEMIEWLLSNVNSNEMMLTDEYRDSKIYG